MKQTFWITLFTMLFGISLTITLTLNEYFKPQTVPSQSVEELKLPPSAGTTKGIFPDHSVNPSSINILLNPEGRIIGGASDGRWFQPEELIPYLTGGEVYHLYSKTDWISDAKGVLSEEEPSTVHHHYTILFPNKKILIKPAFTISGGWDPFPRKPQYISESREKYYPLVKKFLQKLGLKAPVAISEIVQVDLEGDGIDEIIITAANLSSLEKKGPLSNGDLQDQYSLFILYQSVDGIEKGTVVLGSYREQTTYELLFTADVNGDWNMEFLVRETSFNSKSATPGPIRDILLTIENKEPVKLLEYRWRP